MDSGVPCRRVHSINSSFDLPAPTPYRPLLLFYITTVAVDHSKDESSSIRALIRYSLNECMDFISPSWLRHGAIQRDTHTTLHWKGRETQTSERAYCSTIVNSTRAQAIVWFYHRHIHFIILRINFQCAIPLLPDLVYIMGSNPPARTHPREILQSVLSLTLPIPPPTLWERWTQPLPCTCNLLRESAKTTSLPNEFRGLTSGEYATSRRMPKRGVVAEQSANSAQGRLYCTLGRVQSLRNSYNIFISPSPPSSSSNSSAVLTATWFNSRYILSSVYTNTTVSKNVNTDPPTE